MHMGCECVEWIHLAQDGIKHEAVLNAEIYLRVPKEAGDGEFIM